MMTFEGNGSINSGVRGINTNTVGTNVPNHFGTHTHQVFTQGTAQIPSSNYIGNWNANPSFVPTHTHNTPWYPNSPTQLIIDPVSGVATLIPVQQTLPFGQGYGISATQGWTPVNVPVFPANGIPQATPAAYLSSINPFATTGWNGAPVGVNPVLGQIPHTFAPGFAHTQTANRLPVDGFERSAIFCPATCVSENNLCFSVTCELPGVAEKDIDVIWHHGSLVVRGQKRNRNIEDDCQVCVTDQTTGQFFRAINLTHVADCIDSTKITTKCTNGVLEVTLPKVRQSTGSYFKVGSTK